MYSITVGGWEDFADIKKYFEQCCLIVDNEMKKKNFFIVGLCKHANIALVLSKLLSEKYADKQFSPVGTPFCFNCDNEFGPWCNGEYLSPVLKIYYNNPKYKNYIIKYGDARHLTYDGLKAYQIVPFNDMWTLDQDNATKLGQYIRGSLNIYVKNFISNVHTHTIVLHVLKTNPDIIANFFKSIIDDTRENVNVSVENK